MVPIFLIGGGWRAETFAQTYGRFLQAAARQGQTRIALIVAEEDGGAADAHAQFLRFYGAFETLGLARENAAEIVVSAAAPLTFDKLAETNPTGVFVGGGLTPAYADALCLDKGWLAYVKERKLPYGGFSAGAAIAAEKAIVGGWRRALPDGQTLEIANENAGEDLDLLAVRAGLGLAPFAVEVHATQWGTLTRLVHAVDARLADEGLAIDENTLVEIAENRVAVFGAGGAYRVRRREDRSFIDIFRAGDDISPAE